MSPVSLTVMAGLGPAIHDLGHRVPFREILKPEVMESGFEAGHDAAGGAPAAIGHQGRSTR